jgi:hypothetical protein
MTENNEPKMTREEFLKGRAEGRAILRGTVKYLNKDMPIIERPAIDEHREKAIDIIHSLPTTEEEGQRENTQPAAREQQELEVVGDSSAALQPTFEGGVIYF